jgi:hypothetical protein
LQRNSTEKRSNPPLGKFNAAGERKVPESSLATASGIAMEIVAARLRMLESDR